MRSETVGSGLPHLGIQEEKVGQLLHSQPFQVPAVVRIKAHNGTRQNKTELQRTHKLAQ